MGEDFEKISGFPNFWGWGFEDNILYERCVKYKLNIDRSNFYKIGDENIIQLFHGNNRVYNKRETAIYKYETPDNMNDLSELNWDISNNIINITSFKCKIAEDSIDMASHNIITNKIPVHKKYFRRNWNISNLYTYIN